jgi:predicted DNA-binding ribbon-helix-helix protein
MPLDIDIKSNPASVSRSQGIRRLMLRPSTFRETAKALIPSKRLRKDISSLITKLNDRKVEKMNLAPALRTRLLDRYYINEIKDLEKLLGRDLSIWYQF